MPTYGGRRLVTSQVLAGGGHAPDIIPPAAIERIAVFNHPNSSICPRYAS